MASFLCTVDYDAGGDHAVLLEVWLQNDAPPGETTREEVEMALREAATTGKAPEGWTVAVVQWTRRGTRHGGAGDLATFDTLIRSTEIDVEEKPMPKQGTQDEGE